MKRNILKNMTAAIAALFIALLALPHTALAQIKEAYVVEDGSTLTFYYDTNKATHTTGTVYGINDKRKDDTTSPAWAGAIGDPNERITKVVFDSSFKEYKPATTNSWFYFCSKLTAIEGMSNLITDKVTDMARMFENCKSLKALDVSSFNTEKVTYMSDMFSGCESLTSLDVSNFNTANVTNMNRMFISCKALKSLNVSNFNTAKVKYMNSMFSSCSALTSLNVSNFNTGNVTGMNCMFGRCSSLKSLDVTKFNTAKVTDMRLMFISCSSLTSLNVSNFNTGNVTNMFGMFYGCKALTSLDVSNFNTANVTSMESMFLDCKALTSLDVSNFNTAKVTDISTMFSGCSALTTIFCNDDWKSDVVKSSYDMFTNCTKLKGAVAYHPTKMDVSMANPTTGYFTKKSATGITAATVDIHAARRGIYNLQGVKMQGSLDLLPAGVYIVDGKKIVKK
ncbi:MAG: BspA family leucine-rich repeat surface protein [Prevotella sp.]|nr:BspA family leucine-rich repeat surface protein [Prevotella sp.]